MEWIRISSNKLKIMLTAEDARRYALRFERADYADTGTRRAFREILTDVRKKTGFDATEDKVYIQMYPSKEGGCELFVTKVGAPLHGGEKEHATSELSPAPKPTEELRQMAFRFDSMEKLLAVCRRLATTHRTVRSEAFTDDGGRFWLLMTEKGDAAQIAEDYIFIPEYGKIEDAEAAALRLTEHGRVLCAERAVEILGKL